MNWRTLLGAALLILQGGAIVRARFAEDRYFCWAPFDQQTKYAITAEVDGQPLAPAEISRRYRRPANGYDNRSAHHLFDIVARAEAQNSKPARVLIQYTVNGLAARQWRYPQ